jgi:hypothetical protein
MLLTHLLGCVSDVVVPAATIPDGMPGFDLVTFGGETKHVVAGGKAGLSNSCDSVKQRR